MAQLELTAVGTYEELIAQISELAFEKAHPVHSLYWSEDPTDPKEVLGGDVEPHQGQIRIRTRR